MHGAAGDLDQLRLKVRQLKKSHGQIEPGLRATVFEVGLKRI
jgi:hypothetical protein